MTITTFDSHSRTNGFLSRADDLPIGEEPSTVVYRIESQLRDVIHKGMGAHGVLLIEECDARVTSGPFIGGRLRGFDRVTLRSDGSTVIEGCEDIDVGNAHVAVDIRASVTSSLGTRLPSSEVIADPGYDLPDEDLRITGTALIRSTAPRYAHLDGTVARVEGWVNFASGELEIEARAASDVAD
jgi:hypothetical protein